MTPPLTRDQIAAIQARAEKAKRGPWTSSPQEGEKGHCNVAQVFDENGHSLAELEPTIIPGLATDTAAHIAGMNPEETLVLCQQALRAVELEAERDDYREGYNRLTAELTATRKALEGERERCAKVAERVKNSKFTVSWNDACDHIAEHIRALPALEVRP